MRTITYHLLTNQVTESDSVYPNAFSADDNTTQLIFDFTGTACESWDKWLDLTMSDYTKDVQHLGTDAIVSFNLGAEHTKKGLLQVNPYAKNGTDKHGFPIYKLTIERQLNNSTVDASAQQSMIDYFDARLTVKAVNTTTLGAGESATASVTVEPDGATYTFGVPQGIQGIQGIQGGKGAQWRGAYSAGTAYVVDDVVSYNGSSYICVLASTGNLPTNATYWSLLAQKGDNTTASAVTNTPAGNIAATTVQGAINELDTEKADKLFATNLVTNGDFSNGTTGWSATASTNTVSNKVLSNTGNGSSQYVRAYTDTAQSVVVGNKIYARFSMKVTNANCTQILCQVQGNVSGSAQNFFSQFTPTQNQVYTSSSVITMGAGTGVYRLQFWHYYPDATTANGKVMETQYVSLIDLTAIFGAGKEPSAIQMDNLLSTFPNSWFNGTAELVNIANLAQLKADKTQEAWITPTLQSGWLEYGAGFETVRYMKDQFGFVHLKGLLKSGTVGVVCMTLPAGYRPSVTQHIATASNNAFGFVTISNLGVVAIMGGSNVWFSLNNITFKAEA